MWRSPLAGTWVIGFSFGNSLEAAHGMKMTKESTSLTLRCLGPAAFQSDGELRTLEQRQESIKHTETLATPLGSSVRR